MSDPFSDDHIEHWTDAQVEAALVERGIPTDGDRKEQLEKLDLHKSQNRGAAGYNEVVGMSKKEAKRHFESRTHAYEDGFLTAAYMPDADAFLMEQGYGITPERPELRTAQEVHS